MISRIVDAGNFRWIVEQQITVGRAPSRLRETHNIILYVLNLSELFERHHIDENVSHESRFAAEELKADGLPESSINICAKVNFDPMRHCLAAPCLVEAFVVVARHPFLH